MRTDAEIAGRLTRLADGWAEISAAEEWARSFSAEERRQLAKEGKALPDGSYPIRDATDIPNALTLARSGHGNASGAMALIRRRAKALGYKLAGA